MIPERIFYVMPTPLGEDVQSLKGIPSYNLEVLQQLDSFIVEDIRQARRLLRRMGFSADFNSVHFFELNEHTSKDANSNDLKKFILSTNKIGLLSDAGCPIIADPGSMAISIARKLNYKIVALVGPSSILLALMQSGFNGQNFCFHGYLPIEKQERINALKQVEKEIYQKNQTQIFIETPYRNLSMIADILQTCKGSTQLCIAANLTTLDEFVVVNTVDALKKQDFSMFTKVPAVFLLYK